MFWVSSALDSGNNFNFTGGGGVLEPNSRTGVFWRIWSKISGSLAGWCITDSLSHTTYVETNNLSNMQIRRVTYCITSRHLKDATALCCCLLIFLSREFQKMTLDVITSVAFGIETETVKNGDSIWLQKVRWLFDSETSSSRPLLRRIIQFLLSKSSPLTFHNYTLQ